MDFKLFKFNVLNTALPITVVLAMTAFTIKYLVPGLICWALFASYLSYRRFTGSSTKKSNYPVKSVITFRKLPYKESDATKEESRA